MTIIPFLNLAAHGALCAVPTARPPGEAVIFPYPPRGGTVVKGRMEDSPAAGGGLMRGAGPGRPLPGRRARTAGVPGNGACVGLGSPSVSLLPWGDAVKTLPPVVQPPCPHGRTAQPLPFPRRAGSG